MPELLPVTAVIRCDHQGRVQNVARQDWVTIAGDAVLVDADPQGRTISACPNRGANIRPCQTTLAVAEGYSTYVRIDGRRAVLASLEGKTDGTPPGFVDYVVRDPAQRFVVVDR